MKMSNRAVLDGVRGLLSQHAYEYARNNKIHMAMLPWTRKYAAGRFTVLNEKSTPGGRYSRHQAAGMTAISRSPKTPKSHSSP